MMPGKIQDHSMTVGSLPGLSHLTRLPSLALPTEELKYTDIHNIGAMITPLHFLEVKLGKRPQPVKNEEELKQLILMLNRHRPTCIVRTDSIKTPTQKATHCWSSWRRGTMGWEEEEEEQEMRRGRRRRVPEGSSLLHGKLFNEAQNSQHRPGFFVKLRSATPGEETQADETQDQKLRPK
ncbi:hypothetical protein QTO34_004128 [Cnephaeus nilssonii]|uniref:Uncharacterized protein n=1 Tax=Cnephaeus nilssonii TaxID=3371016 RepID=A0AA40HS86_CNENI|nr:hypothetical protein QTO34_004128 [Eptesicus nilssonii]